MKERERRMNNPKVSIIVPVYNGEAYVQSCMNNILAQSYSNFEVIIVDDGSKDNTGNLCDECGKKDTRIKVIHQKNKGLSGARNTGIQYASGEYVLFVDIDDAIEKDTVKDNVQLASEYDSDVVMYCFWYYFVDQNKLVPNNMKELFVGTDQDYFDQMLIPTLNNEVFNAPWNKLIKKSVLVNNNIYFNEKFPIYEDITFAALLLGACKKIVVNPQMYYKYYYKTSGSLISSFKEVYFPSVTQYYKNAMKYCEKYENHTEQENKLSELYCKLTITHIKQIACNKQITKEKRNELLDNIFNSELFLKALNHSGFTGKKKIMISIIKKRHKKSCVFMYKVLNFLQNSKK